MQLSMIYAPPKVDETQRDESQRDESQRDESQRDESQREKIIVDNIMIEKPTKGFLSSNKIKNKNFDNFKTLYYYLSTICDTYDGKLYFNNSNITDDIIDDIKEVKDKDELLNKIPSLKPTDGTDINKKKINDLIKGLKTAATAAAPGANGGAPPNNNFVPTNKNNSKTQKRRHRKSRAITVTNKHNKHSEST
jgi:hypothetical protein